MNRKSKLIALLGLVLTVTYTHVSIAQMNTKLEYLTRLPKDKGKNAPLLVFVHGYGSNEQDMFSLASKIPDHWLVILVRAPHCMGVNSYKWYDVALESGKIKINAKQEEQSRRLLKEFIGETIEKYNGDKQKVVVAGFSQGANMSLSLALTWPESVSGFACFSGRFLVEIQPQISHSPGLKRLKAFIAHGTEDKMLPITYAEESIRMLKSMGIETEFVQDQVAHTISDRQVEAFNTWLKQF